MHFVRFFFHLPKQKEDKRLKGLRLPTCSRKQRAQHAEDTPTSSLISSSKDSYSPFRS